MSLFVCSECRTVDNTALTDFWIQGVAHGQPEGHRLCSACLTGEWHGRFEQKVYEPGRTVQWMDGKWIETAGQEK